MASFASDEIWRKRYDTIDPGFDSVLLPDPDDLDDRLDQDEEWCEVRVNGSRERVRFHDYHDVYRRPGLYEAIFYDELGCCSPSAVVHLLQDVLRDHDTRLEQLRVLDLGAGNGMVGDELDARGVDRVVGVDLIDEAREATRRDRPGVYEDYVVTDMTELDAEQERELRAHRFNTLTSVAALGYGDIPPEAFLQAMDLISTPGWMAFNVKEDFLRENDDTGFSRLVRELSRREIVQIQSYRRYCHRRSVVGDPLHYVGMVARKLREVPDDLSF